MSGQNNANLQFHSDCSNYFDSLREKGETDFEFEDEYFFTLPAISQMRLDKVLASSSLFYCSNFL